MWGITTAYCTTIDIISDYKSVYVAAFKRIAIPEHIHFPHIAFTEDKSISSDVKHIIIAHLEPYVDTLEKLVGKEVPTSKALPRFGDGRFGLFRFPETKYNLALHEYDSASAIDALVFKDFALEDIETQEPSRKIALVINRIYGLCDIRTLATVGGMAYEGRK